MQHGSAPAYSSHCQTITGKPGVSFMKGQHYKRNGYLASYQDHLRAKRPDTYLVVPSSTEDARICCIA